MAAVPPVAVDDGHGRDDRVVQPRGQGIIYNHIFIITYSKSYISCTY